MMQDTLTHPIAFVGAGPGDPDLITVKGRKLLENADLVVFAGSLVPKALVHGLQAETVSSAGMNLEQIIELMADRWRQGKKIVRLHTGDPSLYGAIKEQMMKLRELGIDHTVIPGVSSAFAAAAALQAELTLPEVSQTVIICRRAGRTPVPEKENLRSLAVHQASMLIFLSVGMISEVVDDLLAGGYPPSTPVAVVEKASRPEEKTVRAALCEIAAETQRENISKTAIIAVGEVFRESDPEHLSRLYDKNFSHGCRNASKDGKQ